MGGLRCVIECRLRRLYCPGCGDLPEHVEWARGGVRYTRDFDDLVAWLAQQMNQTQLTRLMRDRLGDGREHHRARRGREAARRSLGRA